MVHLGVVLCALSTWLWHALPGINLHLGSTSPCPYGVACFLRCYPQPIIVSFEILANMIQWCLILTAVETCWHKTRRKLCKCRTHWFLSQQIHISHQQLFHLPEVSVLSHQVFIESTWFNNVPPDLGRYVHASINQLQDALIVGA